MYVPGLDYVVHGWWKRWVLRGRRGGAEPSRSDPGWVLELTARYRWSIYALTLLFSCLYSWAFFVGEPFADEPHWKRIALEGGSALLWALVLCVFAATVLERVVITDSFVRRRSWRGHQEVEWRSLESVELKLLEEVIDLRSSSGSRVSLSMFLDGLEVLLPLLERHWGPTVVARLRPHLPSGPKVG